MLGLPEDTDIMIPIPTAMMTPIVIQIGETRPRTPLCHRARATPTTRTKYPTRNRFTNFIGCPSLQRLSLIPFLAAVQSGTGGRKMRDIQWTGMKSPTVVPLPSVHMAGSNAHCDAHIEVGQHGFALFLAPDATHPV